MRKNLFVLDGAAGTGKTDLLQYIRRKYSRGPYATVLFKYTTRRLRTGEVRRRRLLDLIPISAAEFSCRKEDQSFVWYPYGDAEYGFLKGELDAALNRHDNVLLIVRHRPTIKWLQSEYADVRVIPVFVYADASHIRDRLRGNPRELRRRLARSREVWRDYVQEPFFYEEVIINNFDKKTYQTLIEKLLEKYNSPAPSTTYTMAASRPRHLSAVPPN